MLRCNSTKYKFNPITNAINWLSFKIMQINQRHLRNYKSMTKAKSPRREKLFLRHPSTNHRVWKLLPQFMNLSSSPDIWRKKVTLDMEERLLGMQKSQYLTGENRKRQLVASIDQDFQMKSWRILQSEMIWVGIKLLDNWIDY